VKLVHRVKKVRRVQLDLVLMVLKGSLVKRVNLVKEV
jgi:hypothetical protein